MHGVVFAAWLLLFVAQPVLAGAGAIPIHRALGWLGPLFLVRGAIGLVSFLGLVIAAIARPPRPAYEPLCSGN